MELAELFGRVAQEGYAYNFTPGAVELIADRDDLDRVVSAAEAYEGIVTITEEIVEAVHERDGLPDIDWAEFESLKARFQRGEDVERFQVLLSELRHGAVARAREGPEAGPDAIVAPEAPPVSLAAASLGAAAPPGGGQASGHGPSGAAPGHLPCIGSGAAEDEGGERAGSSHSPALAAPSMSLLAGDALAVGRAAGGSLLALGAVTTVPVETPGEELRRAAEDAAVRVLGRPRATLARGDLATTAQVLMEYRECLEPRGDVKDFVNLFSSRYRRLKKLLERRSELGGLTSIEKASAYSATSELGREGVSIIGLVSSKGVTKNGHLTITLEDPTGSVRVLVTKDKRELMAKGSSVVLDEVVGVRGSPGSRGGGAGGDVLFANDIVFPDVPYRNPMPRTKDEVYAAFISDLHVGSKMFLQEDFERFLAWLRGDWGDRHQRRIAERVGYLLVAGDLVDGIGIYKGQEKELGIRDICRQYEAFARLIERVPDGVQTVIIPGNHDVSREAEPQPAVFQEFARELYQRDRFILTSNPSLVRLHECVDVLLYHGASIDSMIDALPHLKDGYNSPHIVMEELVRKRHLNPIYGHKTRVFPEREDHLVIEPVPNVFHAGHVHTLGLGSYRDLLLVNSGAFQGRTEFQVRLGHHPTPSVIPVLNLRTGEPHRISFAGGKGGSA